MLDVVKNSSEIKINLDSGNGYFVVNHKLYQFNTNDIEDIEVFNYIVENGEQVSSEWDITSKYGEIFEYSIYNNGEYEFSEDSSLYSHFYLSSEEFLSMCKKAQDEIRKNGGKEWETKMVSHVKGKLKELYPEIFIQIAFGKSFNTKEWD